MRYWKPEDIFTVACPHCRAEIEFWKDEPHRVCPSCRKEVRNPKQDFGCAEWCKHGSECLDPEHGDKQQGQSAPLAKPGGTGGDA